MEIIEITCKMCGKTFNYHKKSATGVLPKYCSNECRELAVKAAKKRYIENAKDKKAAKSKLKKMMEQSIVIHHTGEPAPERAWHEEKNKQEETSVDIAYERQVMPVADDLTMKVLDFAMRLGQLKYEGHELLNEINKIVSEQDKQDQKFLHIVEAMDKLTIEQMKEIWKEEADSRTNRRDAKTLYQIINQLIYNIPQHPHQYAKEIIERKNKQNEKYAELYANDGNKPND